jgi:hypothetical protein
MYATGKSSASTKFPDDLPMTTATASIDGLVTMAAQRARRR